MAQPVVEERPVGQVRQHVVQRQVTHADLVVATLCDVGDGGDEAAAGHRRGLDVEDGAVGTLTLVAVGLAAAGDGEAVGDHRLGARDPVLLALDVQAQDVFERHPELDLLVGETEKLEVAPVEELPPESERRQDMVIEQALEGGIVYGEHTRDLAVEGIVGKMCAQVNRHEGCVPIVGMKNERRLYQ